MFEETLKGVVEDVNGSLAAILMGYDGIAVAQFVREGAAFDVETVGMEYSVILTQIRQAAELLEAGTMREVSIGAERVCTVVRALNDEYFAAVALLPDGNAGKARYLLRIAAPKMADAL